MKTTLSTIITYFCFLLFTCVNPAIAQQREIALTIDDLPFVGEDTNYHLEKIIDTLVKNGVPATGFVIANQVNARNRAVLQKFRDAGFAIGNHTMTHANINRMNAAEYIEEIKQADDVLSPYLTKPKFFRYPYMATGEGESKESVQDYLINHHYHAAPITIDSRDFVFNQLLLAVTENERRFFINVLKPCYVDFIWEQTIKANTQNKANTTHILLIHANLLNAYALEDIITLYKQNGYTFVSLEKALKSNKLYQKTPQKKPDHPGMDNYVAWD